jgi:hypothetical protein
MVKGLVPVSIMAACAFLFAMHFFVTSQQTVVLHLSVLANDLKDIAGSNNVAAITKTINIFMAVSFIFLR